MGSRGLARRDDLHNPPFDPLFLFAAPLETERINRPPELELGLSPVDLRLELQEVKLEFGVCRPAVTRGVRNIPDVPLTLGSGRKEDQIAAFQQKDAVLAIFPDDPAQGNRDLDLVFRHAKHLLTSSPPCSLEATPQSLLE